MFDWLRNWKDSGTDAWECEPEVTNYRTEAFGMDDLGGLNGMSEREEEEFFSTYGPTRKMRKEMRRRVKEREDAKKRQDKP